MGNPIWLNGSRSGACFCFRLITSYQQNKQERLSWSGLFYRYGFILRAHFAVLGTQAAYPHHHALNIEGWQFKNNIITAIIRMESH